eukprot:TRINITY_DN20204_c0_g1_i10.p1 TRINITY_DN20204_c0_g1~~TRINITY_DN20204_c0_g1_i10.p1  ORF type:complete len:173 (-),score=59.49 TRINITY_DN20204_c0_g1_i10:114-608(-)
MIEELTSNLKASEETANGLKDRLKLKDDMLTYSIKNVDEAHKELQVKIEELAAKVTENKEKDEQINELKVIRTECRKQICRLEYQLSEKDKDLKASAEELEVQRESHRELIGRYNVVLTHLNRFINNMGNKLSETKDPRSEGMKRASGEYINPIDVKRPRIITD